MLRILLLFSVLLVSAFPASVTLYDDTLGTTPGSQPWLVFGNDSLLTGGVFSETVVPSGVRLVTDNAVSAGYGSHLPFFNTPKNPALPVLDPGPGFALRFQLQVNSEAHANNNRAGFSVILLGYNSLGIELAFWGNEIWAQSGPTFTQAEGVAFNTTAAEIQYELQIMGGTYTLLAGGNPILSNSVRNYSSFGTPYNLPNFVFLGDNTSSAGADISLGRVELITNEVPEPGTLGLACLALLGMVGYRRDLLNRR